MKLRQLFEKKLKTVVFAFGRMNPPTTGHAKLIERVKSLAQENSGDAKLFVSHKQNSKTDPLDFTTKISFLQKFFPDIEFGDANSKTIMQILKKLEKQGYEKIIYVAGDDRRLEFKNLIEKYNNIEYSFQEIKIESSGKRDPDSEDVTGMSATKMKKAAQNNDYDKFLKGVPDNKYAKELFKAVKTGMKINESITEKHKNGTYSALYLSNKSAKQLYDWCKNNGIVTQSQDEYHCTLIYSRKSINELKEFTNKKIKTKAKIYDWKRLGNALTLEIRNEKINILHEKMINLGATHDFQSYIPHVTINSNYCCDELPLKTPQFDLVFDKIVVEPLEENK